MLGSAIFGGKTPREGPCVVVHVAGFTVHDKLQIFFTKGFMVGAEIKGTVCANSALGNRGKGHQDDEDEEIH
ncbi:MAG: hypothetical protein RR757_03640, partial [Raoultibacter sp.]